MTDNAIEINELQKGYDSEPVLDRLSMTVPAGSIYGFIGQNGSGKSTTLNTLMGLLQPWSGSAKILGEDSWGLSVATRTRIAYVAEISYHFDWSAVQEYMSFVAQFYSRWDQAKADEMLDNLEISPRKNVADLSLGQTRAVSIITAMCCNPDVLILDEPSGNLDVLTRRVFQQYLLEFITRQEGKTVLLSSHVLTDLERVIDRVGIIRKGKLVVEDELDSLKERTNILRLRYEFEPPRSFDVPDILHTEISDNEVRLTVSDLDEQVLQGCECIKAAKKMEIQPMALEDIFVAYSLKEMDLPMENSSGRSLL